jgi:hypothetical protein
MEPDQELQLDSPAKIRLEREWIYFKLKKKVDASGTIQLSEIKELYRLLTEIELSIEGDKSPSQLSELTDSELQEKLTEVRRRQLLSAPSETPSPRGDDDQL